MHTDQMAATSMVMPSNYQNKNSQPLLSENDQTKPAAAAAETTRSSKSRKRKCKPNDDDQKKKKQPQRGMGVAQLERLRLEERWKKLTDDQMSLQTDHHPFVLMGSSFVDHQPTQVGMNNRGVYVDFYGVVGGGGGFNDLCGVCFKRKRLDDENLVCNGGKEKVVEYEFFPEKGKGGGRSSSSQNDQLKLMMMKEMAASVKSSSSNIDLSLKL